MDFLLKSLLNSGWGLLSVNQFDVLYSTCADMTKLRNAL